MAVTPWKSPLGLQFSLRSLLFVTTLIALFYALRRGYLMTAFDLDETIERARNIPTLLTFAAVILAAISLERPHAKSRSPTMRGAMLGATVGALSCLALVFEFGEALRRINYWNWWTDWPLVVPHLVVAIVQGGAIGAFVMQVAGLVRQRTWRKMLDKNGKFSKAR